jgi:hypothetical protein
MPFVSRKTYAKANCEGAPAESVCEEVKEGCQDVKADAKFKASATSNGQSNKKWKATFSETELKVEGHPAWQEDCSATDPGITSYSMKFGCNAFGNESMKLEKVDKCESSSGASDATSSIMNLFLGVFIVMILKM